MRPQPSSDVTVNTIAVSAPGGMSRHYRIQYQLGSKSGWQMFAVHRRRESAEHCLAGLLANGYVARMVTYRTFPPAA